MENASKALLIAGGILLALMTLSLIVYVSTSTTRMAEAQDAKKASEELAAFNASYEAYNKTRMYGTDVITVVNKAINYNGKLDNSQKNEAITIEVEIIEDFTATKQTIEEYADNTVKKGKVEQIGEYSLFTKNGSKTVKVNFDTKYSDDVVKFFQKQEKEDSVKILEERKDRYIKKEITYSALANFKRAIFTCTDCKDGNGDGRIDYMKFEQYRTLKKIDESN